jgi:hypothetical protein
VAVGAAGATGATATADARAGVISAVDVMRTVLVTPAAASTALLAVTGDAAANPAVSVTTTAVVGVSRGRVRAALALTALTVTACAAAMAGVSLDGAAAGAETGAACGGAACPLPAPPAMNNGGSGVDVQAVIANARAMNRITGHTRFERLLLCMRLPFQHR